MGKKKPKTTSTTTSSRNDDHKTLVKNLTRLRTESKSTPYTFLFQYDVQPSLHDSETKPEARQLLNDESKALHGVCAPPLEDAEKYLSFVPVPEAEGGAFVRAWFGDLFLVSEHNHYRKFYICNALTRHCLELPEANPPGAFARRPPFRIALVRRHGSADNFRVALFYGTASRDPTGLHAVVFSSKTRLWRPCRGEAPIEKVAEPDEDPRVDNGYEDCHLHYPWYNGGAAVARGGSVHFLVDLRPSRRVLVVAFDPFLEQWSFVRPPADLRPEISKEFDRPVGLSLGAYRDRLRLAQLSRGEGALRVWELQQVSDTWRLVTKASIAGKGIMYFLGFHPQDCNVVFVYCDGDRTACEFDFASHKLRRIGEFPVRLESYPEFTALRDPLTVFPIVHSYDFPTPLPSLPSF